jgi:hypothetical protein
MAIPKTIEGREYTKFVDSPTRGDGFTSIEVTTSSSPMSLVLDDSNANIIYLAEAPYGSLESEPKWLIKKIDCSSGVKITLASKEYNQIWDDRGTLIYV